MVVGRVVKIGDEEGFEARLVRGRKEKARYLSRKKVQVDRRLTKENANLTGEGRVKERKEGLAERKWEFVNGETLAG